MRFAISMLVCCLATSAVLADATTYTFDATSGSVAASIEGVGSTSSSLDGTFTVTIYASDGHIGESDTFLLEDASLANTELMLLGFAGLIRANLDPGNIRVLDFLPGTPSHIGPAGLGSATSDVYLEATAYITGEFVTTFRIAAWAGELLNIVAAFSTSVTASDVLTSRLDFTYAYDLGMSLSLDLIFSVEGTAHVVPDPSFGGLTALGMAGAAAWLRKRRG